MREKQKEGEETEWHTETEQGRGEPMDKVVSSLSIHQAPTRHRALLSVCRKSRKQDTRHSHCGMRAKVLLDSYSTLNTVLSSGSYLFKPQRNGDETRSWRQRARNGHNLCKMIWRLPCQENPVFYTYSLQTPFWNQMVFQKHQPSEAKEFQG